MRWVWESRIGAGNRAGGARLTAGMGVSLALVALLSTWALIVGSCQATPHGAPPRGAGVASSPARQVSDTPGSTAEEVPLFVFATIADSHITIGGTADHSYMKACDKGAELLRVYVRDINAHVPRVNFVVHLGDVSDRGKRDEFELARKILDSLNCPMYPLVGNHDNFQSDRKLGWKNFAGMDSTYYAFGYSGLRFVAIDCTENPYVAGSGVACRDSMREWVAADLARNRDRHAIILSHYNMWERPWNPQFDTTAHYAEYKGMKALRQTLDRAGNVVAVINGHVHVNRVEIHNGIYYIDVAATLVGRPSIRYFSVFPDRIEVTFAYISDCKLLDYVASLGKQCASCTVRDHFADFVDGSVSDKQFVIPLK
jgi:Icc protein